MSKWTGPTRRTVVAFGHGLRVDMLVNERQNEGAEDPSQLRFPSTPHPSRARNGHTLSDRTGFCAVLQVSVVVWPGPPGLRPSTPPERHQPPKGQRYDQSPAALGQPAVLRHLRSRHG
jgi:hypothetical protein